MRAVDPLLEEAAVEAEELMRAMEICGFDGCHLAWSDSYWVLFVEGGRIPANTLLISGVVVSDLRQSSAKFQLRWRICSLMKTEKASVI